MQNELKPCPFCKETEFIEVRFEKLFNVDFHYVRCQICCARGPMNIYKEKAIEAWNRRAEEE